MSEAIARVVIAQLADAPDGDLASDLSRKCREWNGEGDPEQFLHELRDWAVFTGGASGFVMALIACVIGDERRFPPPVDLENA